MKDWKPRPEVAGLGWAAAACIGLVFAASLLNNRAAAKACQWDKQYWQAELMHKYDVDAARREIEGQNAMYLDGQCCSPSGEGCNEPIYGSDC